MNQYNEDRTRFEVITLLASEISNSKYKSLQRVGDRDISLALDIVDKLDKVMDERRNKDD